MLSQSCESNGSSRVATERLGFLKEPQRLNAAVPPWWKTSGTPSTMKIND